MILCQQELSAVDDTNDNQVQYINEQHTVPIGGKSVMNDQFSLFFDKISLSIDHYGLTHTHRRHLCIHTINLFINIISWAIWKFELPPRTNVH